MVGRVWIHLAQDRKGGGVLTFWFTKCEEILE
jgi:hypothetical protein